jgi:hypothetical protein
MYQRRIVTSPRTIIVNKANRSGRWLPANVTDVLRPKETKTATSMMIVKYHIMYRTVVLCDKSDRPHTIIASRLLPICNSRGVNDFFDRFLIAQNSTTREGEEKKIEA